MVDDTDLVCAYLRGADGKWSTLDWDGTRRWRPVDGVLWIHLDRSGDAAQRYLRQEAGIDRIVTDALLAEESRPRATVFDDGLLINLRGVNLNPGAEPEDMVSLRMWATESRLVTCRFRPLLAVRDVRELMETSAAPDDVGALIVMLATRLVDRVSAVIESLDEQEDDVESRLVSGDSADLRGALTVVRRRAITLRRYLAPQREALNRVSGETTSWMTTRHRARIQEVNDRVIRYIEDLDAIRERAAVIKDEMMNMLSERLNRNMYVLTVISSIMLPLGFLTGLLGINVDGMPGASDSPYAFALVCAAMVAVVGVEVLLLRRLRWI